MDMMVYYQHLPSFLPFCKKFYAQGPGPCQTFQGNGSQTEELQGAMEMLPCADEETESKTGGPARGIQTFQGGARGKLALAFNPDAVSVFPSRCLLRLLSKPFWTAPLFLLV